MRRPDNCRRDTESPYQTWQLMCLKSGHREQKSGYFVAYGFPLLLCLILLNACAVKPVAVITSPAPDSAVAPSMEILIVQPCLRFALLQDETILPDADYPVEQIAAQAIDAARETIESRKLALVDWRKPGQVEMRELCNQLNPIIPSLSRGFIGDETRVLLERLASLNERLAVLVQFLSVKVGPSGYWDPNTGAIGSSMSCSVLQAALVSCSTGRVLWRNQVLLRKLPEVNDRRYCESLELLYQSFPRKKEE